MVHFAVHYGSHYASSSTIKCVQPWNISTYSEIFLPHLNDATTLFKGYSFALAKQLLNLR